MPPVSRLTSLAVQHWTPRQPDAPHGLDLTLRPPQITQLRAIDLAQVRHESDVERRGFPIQTPVELQ